MLLVVVVVVVVLAHEMTERRRACRAVPGAEPFDPSEAVQNSSHVSTSLLLLLERVVFGKWLLRKHSEQLLRCGRRKRQYSLGDSRFDA